MAKPIFERLDKKLTTYVIEAAVTSGAAVAVSTTPAQLYGVHVINTNAADAYLNLYDLAAATPTVGTTATKQTYLVPAAATSTTVAGAIDLVLDNPIPFDTALTYATVTVAGGATGPTIGLVVNLRYK